MSALQLAIAVDQLANALIGGWCDETLSARAWRNGKNSKGWNKVRIVIDLLFFWQKQHCFNSYISEFERKQLPEEYRHG